MGAPFSVRLILGQKGLPLRSRHGWFALILFWQSSCLWPCFRQKKFYPQAQQNRGQQQRQNSRPQQQNNNYRNNQQQWRSNNRGNNSNRNKMTCSFCRKLGHRQEDCRKRINSNQPCVDSNGKTFWPKINTTETGAPIQSLQEQDFQF